MGSCGGALSIFWCVWGRRVRSTNEKKNCSISIGKFSGHSFNSERFFGNFFPGTFFHEGLFSREFFSGNFFSEDLFSRDSFPEDFFYHGSFFPGIFFSKEPFFAYFSRGLFFRAPWRRGEKKTARRGLKVKVGKEGRKEVARATRQRQQQRRRRRGRKVPSGARAKAYLNPPPLASAQSDPSHCSGQQLRGDLSGRERERERKITCASARYLIIASVVTRRVSHRLLVLILVHGSSATVIRCLKLLAIYFYLQK